MRKIIIGCIIFSGILFATNKEITNNLKIEKEVVKEDLGIPMCSQNKIESNKDCIENFEMKMDNDGEEIIDDKNEKEDQNEK